MKVYISKSNDAAVNLAIEEYLVRDFFDGDFILFLYINSDCVVLGKNQSIYTEVNLPYIYQNKIPIKRRLSGGGTVYHDMGNINFSFITNYNLKDFNNYKTYSQQIIQVLRDNGIDASFNDRNDIVVGEFKVSGNAQFTTKNVILTHGTLLVNSDLIKLSNSLKAIPIKVETYASKSVRAKVANLIDFNPNIEVENLILQITERYLREFNGYLLTDEDINFEQIRFYIENKYSKDEWNLYETPKAKIITSVVVNDKSYYVKILVENCRIKQISPISNIENFYKIEEKLLDTLYLPYFDEKIFLSFD